MTSPVLAGPGTTVLDHLTGTAAAHGLRVRKAIPRGHDHLLLVLSRPDGSRLAGQWFADPAYAAHVARETQASTHDAVEVPVLDGSGVLLQPDGADRRLRALHRLAGAPGATLLAHRAERRALVRQAHDDGRVTYTKNVRPDHLRGVVDRAHVDVGDVTVPQVTEVDGTAGTVTFTALPGRTLQHLLDDPGVSDADVAAAGRAVGAAVARLHATAPPPTAGRHDAVAEVAVTQGWLGRARRYGLLDDTRPPLRDLLAAMTRLLAEPPCAPAYLHRDLHDMQVLLDDDGTVGMLDFDLASTGEPALDLANLLVHLELKALLGGCPPTRAAACADAVVEGYAPAADVWRRVPAYALSTRLRLAAVNAFRPPRAHTALTLLTGDVPGPLRGATTDHTKERR